MKIKFILTALLSSCGIKFVMANNIAFQVNGSSKQTVNLTVTDNKYHDFYPVESNDTAIDKYCGDNDCDSDYQMARLQYTDVSYIFNTDNYSSSDVRNWVLEQSKEKPKAPGKVFKPDKLNFAYIVNLEFRSANGSEYIECPNIMFSQGTFNKGNVRINNWYLYSNIYDQAAVTTTHDRYSTTITCSVNGGKPEPFFVDTLNNEFNTFYIQRVS